MELGVVWLVGWLVG